MQGFVALVVGLSAALTSAAPGRALIWGGGPTHAVADAAHKALEASDVHALLTFAPGFPKRVESRSVKGLKPGLHIVLLGLCGEKDDSTLALSVAKAVEPKVYARRVEFDGTGSCPVLKAPWSQVTSTYAGKRLDLKVVSDQQTLRVLALLQDETGEPLDFATRATPCAIECKNVRTLTSETDATVQFTVVMPSCTTTGEQDFEWQVRVVKKRLSVDVVEGQQRPGACD